MFPLRVVTIRTGVGHGAFVVANHHIGIVPTFSASRGEVGFYCPALYEVFASPADAAPFAAKSVADNAVWLAELGPCRLIISRFNRVYRLRAVPTKLVDRRPRIAQTQWSKTAPTK
jgi:hypothetical protein